MCPICSAICAPAMPLYLKQARHTAKPIKAKVSKWTGQAVM